MRSTIGSKCCTRATRPAYDHYRVRLRFSARASLHAAKSTRKLKDRCSYAHAHAPHSVRLLAQYDADTMARWRTTVSIDAKAARGIAAHVATLQTDRGPAGAHAACALVKLAYASPHHRTKIVQAGALKPLVEVLRDGAESWRRAGLLGRRGRLSSGGRPRARPRDGRDHRRRGRVRAARRTAQHGGGGRGGDGDPDPRHERRSVRAGDRAPLQRLLADGDDRARCAAGSALTALGASKVRLESLEDVESRFFRIVTPS